MFFERSNCPVCNSTEIENYYRCAYDEAPVRDYLMQYYNLADRIGEAEYLKRFSQQAYVLTACKSCACTFQRFCPDENLSREIYERWIRGDNAKKPITDFQNAKHYIAEALKLTALLLRSPEKKQSGALKVLDYGVGLGGFALALKACGCEVYGFDFAKNRNIHGANLGLQMLSYNQIGALKFDFINSEQVLEHLNAPGEVAQRLTSSLLPGGFLKISVPFNRWLEAGDLRVDWSAGRYAKHSPNPNAPLEHLQYFRRPSLDMLGKRLGLERVRISAGDHLRYSLEWNVPTTAIKNIVRIFAFDKFRNYYLFRKLSS